MTRSPAPVLVVDLFPEVRHRLVALLTELPDTQWAASTVCPGWSVKDVALHLLGVNVANISRRRDGFGDAFAAFVPRAADPTDPLTLVETIANWNEAWVVATRRLSPRLLCTLLTVTGKEIEAFYRDLDLLAQGNAVSWAGPDPAPVWLDIAREYTEQWVHQAQIRDALKLPMLDEPRLFAPVLDTFMWALPHTLRDMAWPPDAALRVLITGDAGGEWWAVRRDDQWVLRKELHREADATVTMDQDTAWRLMTKGLSPSLAQRLVKIEGERQLGGKVLEMVAIIA